MLKPMFHFHTETDRKRNLTLHNKQGFTVIRIQCQHSIILCRPTFWKAKKTTWSLTTWRFNEIRSRNTGNHWFTSGKRRCPIQSRPWAGTNAGNARFIESPIVRTRVWAQKSGFKPEQAITAHKLATNIVFLTDRHSYFLEHKILHICTFVTYSDIVYQGFFNKL